MHPSLVYWDLTLPIFAVQARYNVQWTPYGVHWLKEIPYSSWGCHKNETLWKSLGCNMVNGVPRKVPRPKPFGPWPLGFWPWDFPRDSIHHDTPSAFPQIIPLSFPLPYHMRHTCAYHWPTQVTRPVGHVSFVGHGEGGWEYCTGQWTGTCNKSENPSFYGCP